MAHACLGLLGFQQWTPAFRDKVDADAFHKGIQYALEKLGKSKFGFERTAVSNFKRKRHVGSVNEIVEYSRAPCLGADQKTRGLWERDCVVGLPAAVGKRSPLSRDLYSSGETQPAIVSTVSSYSLVCVFILLFALDCNKCHCTCRKA